MDEHREVYKVCNMCRVLKISRSGYYVWRDRLPSTRRRDNADLLHRIQQIHIQSRKLYGSPRIVAELNDQGLRCGKNRVARIMKDRAGLAKLDKDISDKAALK